MATDQTKQTGLRKRQQIDSANKTMFLWVAGASVVVGFAIVIAFFLANKLIFNQRVIAEKQATAATLSENLEKINELKDNISVLNTNAALKSVMTDDESEPVQVVLDALPSDANSAALGASLQRKFLSGSGLKVQSIDVTPVQGAEQTAEGTEESTEGVEGEEAANAITFNFVVTASNPDTLKKLLASLEKSIRTIDVTNVKLDVQTDQEGRGNSFTLTVDGQAFYEPARSVELKEKTVEP